MTFQHLASITTTVSALCLVGNLAACQQGQAKVDDSPAAAVAAAPAPVVATPTPTPRATAVESIPPTISANEVQPTPRDALDFIASRLRQMQTGSESLWMPSNATFMPTQWQWKEVQVAASTKRVSVVTVHEQYEVDPRALSWPVEIKGSTVTFECALTKCIRVQKTYSTMTLLDAEPNESESIEDRPNNSWYFSSEEEAGRVARAMNLVLQNLGAKARQF